MSLEYGFESTTSEDISAILPLLAFCSCWICSTMLCFSSALSVDNKVLIWSIFKFWQKICECEFFFDTFLFLLRIEMKLELKLSSVLHNILLDYFSIFFISETNVWNYFYEKLIKLVVFRCLNQIERIEFETCALKMITRYHYWERIKTKLSLRIIESEKQSKMSNVNCEVDFTINCQIFSEVER